MRLSAAHCRQQQTIQLALAQSESLDHRRAIALKAAAAWEAEAIDAEKRESGNADAPSKLDDAITKEFADEAFDGGIIEDKDAADSYGTASP